MLLISLSLSLSLSHICGENFLQQHGQGSFKLEMFEKHCHIWRKRKFIKWLVVKIFGGFG
jgi:hypothetical protein